MDILVILQVKPKILFSFDTMSDIIIFVALLLLCIYD